MAKTFTGNRVPRLTKFLYPFSGIFRDACYALVGSFLVQYAINTGVLSSDPATFNAQYGVITIAMMIALVWDGINDPIMGFIVEKVHFKLGKFKPWILIGAIGNTLAVLCLFLIRPTTPEGLPDGWAFVGCMIAFYVLWDTFFTMNDIGYWAMLPSLSNDEGERASLTSRVTVCASIGGFTMTAGGMLLPTLLPTVSAGQMYGYMAIGVSALFLLSQIGVFFLCQEHARDEAQDKASEDSSLLDLFRVVVKNSQLRAVVIAMFLYYFAAGVLTGGIGLNYFYLTISYGSGRGGLVATIISVMYVAGMIASQALYPMLIKKAGKKAILNASFIIQMVAYLSFLFLCIPLFGDHPIAYNPAEMAGMDDLMGGLGWAFGGTNFIYYIVAFILFFGQGLMYMGILINFQDAIDYNEYKFGDRRESLISSWRPLDVKLGTALLRGAQYLIFIVSGVDGAVTAISTAESEHNTWSVANNAKPEGEREAVDSAFVAAIDNAMKMVGPANARIFGILIVAILIASITGAYVSLKVGYTITDEEHARMVEELEARKTAVAA